jgi:hypothetical protein
MFPVFEWGKGFLRFSRKVVHKAYDAALFLTAGEAIFGTQFCGFAFVWSLYHEINVRFNTSL